MEKKTTERFRHPLHHRSGGDHIFNINTNHDDSRTTMTGRKDKISAIRKRGFSVARISNGRLRAKKSGLIITGTVSQVYTELFGCWRK